MSLGKRLINTGGVSEAACLTETTDIFGDSSGVALYSLDYDASDESGNYDGTPTDVDFGVGGQINYGARFNGSSSKIVTSIDNSDVESFSFWFYFESGTTEGRALGSNVGSSAGNIEVAISTNGTIDLTLQNLRYLTGSGALGSTGWKHIYYDTNRDLYINGVAHTSGTDYTSSFSNSTVLIGALRTNFGFFNSKIDQVRFFNRVLDESTNGEVSTLYAEEACVHTATTTDNDFPTTNVAYYKLDNSAEDEKGNYDGTESNIEYRFGRYGQAAVFNGSSSYIDSNLQMPSTTTFTFSCWFNKNNSSANYHLIGDFDSSAADSSGRFRIQLKTSDIISVGVGNGTNMDFSEFTPSVSLNNIWRHIAVTIDGTSVKAYIDGSQVGTTDTSLYSLASGVNDFAIGAYHPASGKQNFDGKIDQVRIFSTALDSDQVSQLYNEKPETDTSNFKTVLYEGNGSTQYISNVGFDLDVDNGGDGGLVWIKARDTANSHALYDTVRGATNQLSSDLTAAEASYSTVLSSFDANGFFVETSSIVNTNNDDYVAWVFKGGGEAVSNTDGTITSQVSANTDAGFSIVKYTGTGNASHTVGHGLTNNPPEMVIIKNLDGAYSWAVRHSALDSDKNVYLNATNAQTTVSSTSHGGVGVLSSSNFGFISGGTTLNNINALNNDYIAYCFHSVSGYSKIGSYTGNGNATGPIVYTTDDGTPTGSGGFRPRFLLVKAASIGGNWNIHDSIRDTGDDNIDKFLIANTNNAEGDTSAARFIFNDNGFQVGTSDVSRNSNNETYIYMAFK